MMAPKGAVTSEKMTAIEHLELWKIYHQHWCEHKPSITVYLRESEWMEVGAWVYRNFDVVSGVAFLPMSGHGFKQAPFEAIGEKEYNELESKMPKSVDWSKMREYESDDSALMPHGEVACSGDKCELVGLSA
jgi:ribonucleoside-diphosphate reductase alpha chain